MSNQEIMLNNDNILDDLNATLICLKGYSMGTTLPPADSMYLM